MDSGFSCWARKSLNQGWARHSETEGRSCYFERVVWSKKSRAAAKDESWGAWSGSIYIRESNIWVGSKEALACRMVWKESPWKRWVPVRSWNARHPRLNMSDLKQNPRCPLSTWGSIWPGVPQMTDPKLSSSSTKEQRSNPPRTSWRPAPSPLL
jgi:hypothetical protein